MLGGWGNFAAVTGVPAIIAATIAAEQGIIAFIFNKLI
jgi:hypothetical protein